MDGEIVTLTAVSDFTLPSGW